MSRLIEHETQTATTDDSAELVIRVRVNANPVSGWAAAILDPKLHIELHQAISATIHARTTVPTKD